MWPGGFDQNFVNFYNSNNKLAGTYIKQGQLWTFETPPDQAELAAAAEEERRVRESHIITSTNFDPQDYTAMDLFAAAAATEQLKVAASREDAVRQVLTPDALLGFGGEYFKNLVSDLTFVRQDGTRITFSTDDRALSQTMTLSTQSGLRAGQKVRVYYEISRLPLTVWQVRAIDLR
jgi:hypothetical protein